MENDKKQEEINRLQRQLARLQLNFESMVEDSEEADMMLDWINEIRERIKALQSE